MRRISRHREKRGWPEFESHPGRRLAHAICLHPDMTTTDLSDSRLANIAARAVRDAWTSFADRYRIITRRARLRFESRDWKGMASDHVERLELYSRVAAETAGSVSSILGERSEDRMVWAAMKAVYSGLIAERADWELGETFFNSVTRKIFTTVGVDPRIEFVDTDFGSPPALVSDPVSRSYESPDHTADLVRKILTDAGFGVPFQSLEEDSARVAERIDERLRRVGSLRRVDRADVLDTVFFRGKGAYVIGRTPSGRQEIPLVFALLNRDEGIEVDAVLLTENQVSILFSFTRSYFAADVESPYPLIHFLSSLMPRKRRAELYISIGYDKHGKTELYRDLRRHLAVSGDRFEMARGTRGLVMEVFTLPGYDVVFKVMRDTFGAPKQVTREHVRERYRLVFRHDRAGRLVDAQEFEHLEFPRALFGEDLISELLDTCERTVTVDDRTVTIAHAYVERRVTPLDVYLDDADPEAALAAVLDYGQAIKDMAASGIFPGDMLLKNFGVTRHGRVVFYDYDELTTIDECRFRAIPPARSPEDEMAAEPWFAIGPNDVFPEEFETFLGFSGDLRAAFMEKHAAILSPETWKEWQRRRAAGELIEIFPYTDGARLESASA